MLQPKHTDCILLEGQAVHESHLWYSKLRTKTLPFYTKEN